MELGLFEIKDSHSEARRLCYISKTVKATGKGQVYCKQVLKRHNNI